MRAATPRDGFGLWALMVMLLSPGEWLPRCWSEVGIDVERAVDLTPLRYGVNCRGSVNCRRVGKNTVERESAVGAVNHFV